jgi:error-prone DNA polymerase
VFAAALLSSQPMGFYAPAQIVQDARKHGVEVRPVAVNASARDCTLEPEAASTGGLALRLGLRMVAGLPKADGEEIETERARGGPFASVDDLARPCRLGRRAMDALAEADALAPLAPSRRAAMWDAAAVQASLPFAAPVAEPAAALPRATDGEETVLD